MATKNTPAETDTSNAPELDAFDADDDDPFAEISSGYFKCSEHNGSLVLIKVLSHETGINTVNGESDGIRADAYILDGDQRGDAFLDTLVFGKVIVARLKRQIGKYVLARVEQGEKKPGQNAPWILTDMSKDETARKLGRARLAEIKRQAGI